jgi:hypothetical protein
MKSVDDEALSLTPEDEKYYDEDNFSEYNSKYDGSDSHSDSAGDQ